MMERNGKENTKANVTASTSASKPQESVLEVKEGLKKADVVLGCYKDKGRARGW